MPLGSTTLNGILNDSPQAAAVTVAVAALLGDVRTVPLGLLVTLILPAVVFQVIGTLKVEGVGLGILYGMVLVKNTLTSSPTPTFVLAKSWRGQEHRETR